MAPATAPPPKLAVTLPTPITLKWHPANGTTFTAPNNRTTSPSSILSWHPAMAPPPPAQHTTMAPCNGTTSPPPKLVVALPAPHHSTLQWHPAMVPAMAPHPLPQNWSSPSPSMLQWHPTMAPHPLHPAKAPWCHVQSAKVVRRPPPYWK